MMEYIIDTKDSANDFIDYVKSMPLIIPKINNDIIYFNGDQFEIEPRYKYILKRLYNEEKNRKIYRKKQQDNNSNISSRGIDFGNSIEDIDKLIFGKDSTEHIVAAEIVGEEILLFKNDGSIEKRPNEYWILSSRQLGKDCEKLDGDLFYKYKKTFTDVEVFNKARGILYGKKTPMFNIYDPVEANMVMNGFTFFKGLKVQDVSVLSFDIETTGIAHNEDSKVLLISNTYRGIDGKIIRKLFALDDFSGDQAEMIFEWCNWVREIDPSIMIGHNVFTFDLPYLTYCFKMTNGYDGDLELGKDKSEIKYGKRPKKIRKDGSQSYDVYEAKIFGRQIIDTWILSIKYDFGRKYDNYRLKYIVAEEGLEKKDRIKWDFDAIMPHEIWTKFQAGDIEMWNDFKKYCIEDSDDALKLYDLMIPQFFYYTQSLPMPFQTMSLTATGRQINHFLCRSYLQTGHSIPDASEKVEYEGAISFGNPGVYSHVYKVDVASLYPSIMITEEIYDREKDPKGNFLTMVKHFTKERLENKKQAAETGDRYFKDIEQAQKIVINSAYGLLGASGLNFNSMKNADKVTENGRDILKKGIKWVEDKEFQIINVDTDAFSYTTGAKLVTITEKQAKSRGCEVRDEFQEHITEINSLFKDGIIWEDDGYFQKFIVVKAKNYILFDGKKVKIKGQALKGTGKEKALTDFMNNVIMLMLKSKRDHIFEEYRNVALSIKNDWDINEWCMKKTVTKAVLNPERTQEQKVLDAIQDIHYQEGDKIYLYVKNKDTLCLKDNFDGEYFKEAYYNKLFNTLSIFETLLDPTLFPNYKLVKNKNLL